jgi:hypothetical protein
VFPLTSWLPFVLGNVGIETREGGTAPKVARLPVAAVSAELRVLGISELPLAVVRQGSDLLKLHGGE